MSPLACLVLIVRVIALRRRFHIIALLAVVLAVSSARGQTAAPDGRYIRDWLLAGPFSERHLWLAQAALTLGPGRLAPEEGHPALPLMKDVPRWTRYQAVGSQVNLIDAFGQCENAGALACTTIQAEQAGTATFYLGSDDQVRVWINDRLVHRFDVERPLWPDHDCFTAELQAGANRCFVFVAQGKGNWGFTLRVVGGKDPGTVPLVWDVADVKGQKRELFTPHWRYFAGDGPGFADPGCDDAAWPRVMSAGTVPETLGEPVVWFRTRTWCTRALVNLPCRLSATDVGQVELFLDGRPVCTLGRDSAGETDSRPAPFLTTTVPFMFTAEQQVLAVRVTRYVPHRAEQQFRFQLNLTVADVIASPDDRRFHEFAAELRSDMSRRLHRLLLMMALLLFLVFHAALLYYYPKRRANFMFCITLGLSLATLLVLNVQENAGSTPLSESLYWVFLAMVPACMLSGLALMHALWCGDLPKRKLLVWGAILAALYMVAWTKGVRSWAFVALPLCTLEFLRLYVRNAWRKTPGAWVFGVGLACFVAAQAVSIANHLVTSSWSSNGLVAYFWVYGFVALLACVSVYIGGEFAGAFRKLEDLTATLDRRVQQVTQQLEVKLLAQARLETLRYQLNPHFLFNAMNSIEALSREDPAQIPEVVRRLCECLRYALHPKKGGLATLQQELDAVVSYLGVEKVRFEEQLAVDMDVADDARGQIVPEFLLQPLVENAVKYGMRTSEMPLRVQIRAGCANDRLQVEVRNTGSWSRMIDKVDGGVGLENLRNRLELLYPANYRLATQESAGWVSVVVEIPLHGGDNAQAPDSR